MIYVNGCSYTYGDELSDRNMAWPNILGTKLKQNVVNDAISGGTNYRTLYQTTKNLEKNYNLYIIAWTSTARYTFYKSENNFEINFNPQLKNDLYGKEDFYLKWGEILYKHWYNELYSFKIWLQQILCLQALFEKNNKKYLMINTMPNNLNKWLVPRNEFIESTRFLINFYIMNDEQIFAEYDEIHYYVNCINKNNYFKWNEFTIDSLTDLYPTGKGGHILDAGHACVADLIYDYLNV